ncbi:MAG: methylenetetrahydrofolate reductase [Marinobacter sp.]|nr:methylenetetrahydrofolate reductase [Marinobacter sp.]
MKLAYQRQNGKAEDPQTVALVRELVRAASIEATPRQILEVDAMSELLPVGTWVYVPFLPHGQFSETLPACQRLIDEGMLPVPHLPARLVESLDQLRDWLGQLREIGVDRLMLIAGDSDSVAGPFPDTLALLESGLLEQQQFLHLGVAGHPDGHPVASPDSLRRALSLKRDYARVTGTRLWVVTQFAFEADSYTGWLQALGDTLPEVPVYMGVAGPTNLKTLIAYAAQCGVGVSARTMWRKPGSARLLRSWTPDGLVHALARHRQDFPDTRLAGIHLFPFGGLQRSARWIREYGETDEPDEARGSLSDPVSDGV